MPILAHFCNFAFCLLRPDLPCPLAVTIGVPTAQNPAGSESSEQRCDGERCKQTKGSNANIGACGSLGQARDIRYHSGERRT